MRRLTVEEALGLDTYTRSVVKAICRVSAGTMYAALEETEDRIDGKLGYVTQGRVERCWPERIGATDGGLGNCLCLSDDLITALPRHTNV